MTQAVRRFRDAALLLVAASNTYHFTNAAARLWLAKRGLRANTFDAAALRAVIVEHTNTALGPNT